MITPSDPTKYREEYLRYTAKATELIHDRTIRGQIVKSLQGPDPVSNVAKMALMVVQRMDAAARQSGIEVQDAVKIYAGLNIVEQITELLEASGGANLNKDLKLLAFSVCVQDYIKEECKAGRMNAQKVGVLMNRQVRGLPETVQREIRTSPKKLQMIARKYNHGKGLDKFPPDPPPKSASKPASSKAEPPKPNTPPQGLIGAAKGA